MRKEIDREIKQAFDSDLQDAVQLFTGESTTQSNSLDDWIGNDTSDNTTAIYTGRGVFSGYNSFEVLDDSVMRGDVRLICLQSEVTQEPKADDIITQGDSKYRVVSIAKDPVNASYSIQLRGE